MRRALWYVWGDAVVGGSNNSWWLNPTIPLIIDLILLSQAFSEFENNIAKLEGFLGGNHDPINGGNHGDSQRDEL